jgi:hypothetical protein
MALMFVASITGILAVSQWLFMLVATAKITILKNLDFKGLQSFLKLTFRTIFLCLFWFCDALHSSSLNSFTFFNLKILMISSFTLLEASINGISFKT